MRAIRKLLAKLNWSKRRYFAFIGVLLFVTYIISVIYQIYKPLPEGLAYKSEKIPSQVEFLADRTYLDINGKQHTEQQIFDAVLNLIAQAQTTIVLDMFLFNSEIGDSTLKHRPLTKELTEALLQKKSMNPMMEIKVITDPVNTVYGGVDAPYLHQLKKKGVDVIITDLTPLRASNPLWSGLWYMCCQGLGNNAEGGWLKNPLGAGQVTIRSYLDLLNFKANHRKVLVVDGIDGWKALISSANPHDGSSEHSNVAMIVQGKLATHVLESEGTVAKMSQGDVPMVIMGNLPAEKGLPTTQILTEQAILEEILSAINQLKAKDHLDLFMFYFSERQIIEALKAAQQRGVDVRVLLDPNKDAFGREKNGMPNRQVAWELHQANIDVRWCNTQGEQCHSKLLVMTKADGTRQVILGSANYTARNLKNYNLESNISVVGASEYPALQQAQSYFDRAWTNQDQQIMSLDYEKYKDESNFKYWAYRFLEWSGLSTF